MNEQLDIYEVEVGQNSKGMWFCKSLQINNSKITLLTTELDQLIDQVDKVLADHNQKEEDPETKAD